MRFVSLGAILFLHHGQAKALFVTTVHDKGCAWHLARDRASKISQACRQATARNVTWYDTHPNAGWAFLINVSTAVQPEHERQAQAHTSSTCPTNHGKGNPCPHTPGHAQKACGQTHT